MLTSEADTALADLDKTITESFRLLEHLKDPTHADAVMADQRVAAAAHVAMEASRALKVITPSSQSIQTAEQCAALGSAFRLEFLSLMLLICFLAFCPYRWGP